MKFRYTLHADESGVAHISEAALVNDPYLGVIGCIVRDDLRRDWLTPAFRQLKAVYFPGISPNLINFQRTDILNRRGVFAALQDPIKAAKFDADLLKIFSARKYRIIAVVLEKREHVNEYGYQAKEPYGYCAEALLERYCLYLANQNAVGDVIFEARGATLDRELRNAWSVFYRRGTAHASPRLVQRVLTSGDVQIKPKEAGFDGMQLVDMIANPAKNSVLTTAKLRPPTSKPYCREVHHAIEDRFDCHWSGETWGYGKVLLLPPNEKTALEGGLSQRPIRAHLPATESH